VLEKRNHYCIVRGILLCLLLNTSISTVLAQQDFSKVEVRTTELTPGLYMLSSGQGGNVGVSIGADGVFLIDDELTPLTPKIQQAISALTQQPIRFLLNTHWHFDHTGGNDVIGSSGAVIIAHDNVRKRMEKGQFMAAFNMEIPPAPAHALPIITFSENVTVHFNNDTLDVVHHSAPAHTDGDAVVYFKEANVVHMGDLFWNGIYPLIDGGSGGSTAGMIDAVASVLARIDDNTKVIPGHGLLGTKSQLQAYHDMLLTVHTRIKKLHDQGKSVEEIIKAKPTADFDELWGKGLFNGDQWVGIVHSAL
jgi:cyclase